MYTATICNHRPHITHYHCKPVKVLEITDSQALIAPITVTQDWQPYWMDRSLLSNLHLIPTQPVEDLGTRFIVSAGEVLEV